MAELFPSAPKALALHDIRQRFGVSGKSLKCD